MTAMAGYFSSSIGKKQIMAITGLALSLFVLAHMAGNLLFLVGPEAYNAYGHALVSNPLIYFAEAGLVVLFFVHLGCAVQLTIENRAARPVGYYVPPSGAKGGITMASRFMILSGLLVAVFVVLHLITFKFGAYYATSAKGEEIRDLYRLMVEVFQSPVYVVWYLVALAVLGLHLAHGVSSAAQTFGAVSPGREVAFTQVGVIFGVVIAVGFSVVPLYIIFFLNGGY